MFTDPSNVCGFGSGGVSGIITTPAGSDPIGQVGVTLMNAGQAFASYTTTTNGMFNFPIVPAGQSFELTVERDDNARNGVSTLDLVRLQQHLLGKDPLNDPYLMIAADANNSGHVSAVDLVEIRKVILGRTSGFQNNRSWRFVPTSFSFVDPFQPWPFDESVSFIMEPTGRIDNFMGVKVGDLNSSAQTNFGGVTPRSARSTVLELTDMPVEAGEEASVTISLGDLGRRWNGAQWALAVEGLQIMGISSAREDLPDDMWFQEGDEIRFAWAALNTTDAGELVTLRVRALTSGQLSQMIRLTEDLLAGEAYDASNETYALELHWREATTSPAPDVQLHANYPNPWKGSTMIPFDVPEAGEAILVITDASGRQLDLLRQDVGAGRHQFELTNAGWSAGVYYYTLRFRDTQLTRKMLILE